VVLAHAEQRPPATVLERRTQFVEEVPLDRVVPGVEDEGLLELVEDQQFVAGAEVVLRAPLAQVAVEAQVQQLAWRALAVRSYARLERLQRAQQVPVGVRDRGVRAERHPDHGGHLEPAFQEPRDQAGSNERCLPRPGRGVQQHDALGDQEVDQPPDLAIAAVDRFPGEQRSGSHERVRVQQRFR